MDIEREHRRSQVVNLTPLIDVVFLLIVFFMLSTSFVVSESMELSLPSQGAKKVAASDVWIVRVLPDGQIAADETRYDHERFNMVLQSKLQVDAEQKILVLAAAGATVQQLVTVLDKIYLAGGRQVQIDHDAESFGGDVKLVE